MAILLGTLDGVWRAGDGGCERLGLAGRWVNHLASRGEALVAAISGDGLYELAGRDERRIWEGDARCCAIGPDGSTYVGSEPAMVHRRELGGDAWTRCDAIDALPSRGEWTFPGPSHQPHVLSIDFLPGEEPSVLAGIEVGGVILSDDRGRSWQERNAGVYVDVHSVRPDPSAPGRLLAVTGNGYYASEDRGESWERRMEGLGNGYTTGLAINPERAGEVLVASGDRPPGLNGRIYHSVDAGKGWVEIRPAGLPTETQRVSVPLFAEGAAWLATADGQLLRAAEPRGEWTLVHELPSCINALTAGGSPSAVTH